jgi:hypothetical protein
MAPLTFKVRGLGGPTTLLLLVMVLCLSWGEASTQAQGNIALPKSTTLRSKCGVILCEQPDGKEKDVNVKEVDVTVGSVSSPAGAEKGLWFYRAV